MHLFIATRGVYEDVNKFMAMLRGKFLPWMFKPKGAKKKEKIFFQMGVQPIQLWSINFPKEYKDIVLNTVFHPHDYKGEPQNKAHKMAFAAIRKMLGKGVKPIPDYKIDKAMPIDRGAVNIMGIGIKEDRETEHGEML